MTGTTHSKPANRFLAVMQGVTQGYLRYLRIQGIGYRAALQEQTLTFKLGYSHDITYTLPTSLRAFLPEPTLVGIYGIDKNQVSSDPLLGKSTASSSPPLPLLPVKRCAGRRFHHRQDLGPFSFPGAGPSNALPTSIPPRDSQMPPTSPSSSGRLAKVALLCNPPPTLAPVKLSFAF